MMSQPALARLRPRSSAAFLAPAASVTGGLKVLPSSTLPTIAIDGRSTVPPKVGLLVLAGSSSTDGLEDAVRIERSEFVQVAQDAIYDADGRGPGSGGTEGGYSIT